MESLYAIAVITCIFLVAVIYTCIRISYISSGQILENSVTLPNSTPVVRSTIQELERRLSKVEELPTVDSETTLPNHTHCDGCKAFAGRIRAEEKLANQAIYPHLGANNFLVKNGQ